MSLLLEPLFTARTLAPKGGVRTPGPLPLPVGMLTAQPVEAATAAEGLGLRGPRDAVPQPASLPLLPPLSLRW